MKYAKLSLGFLVFFGAFAAAQVSVAPYRTPRVTFTTQAGQPLSGGCVFTYQGGTTTPAATYTDYTGGTSNPNPVILDSTGSAVIWLAANTYKYVVYSSGGTNCSSGQLQYTVDQVPGDEWINGTISGATITGAAIVSSTIDSTTIGGTTPAPVNGSYFNGPIGTGGGTPAAGAFTSVTSGMLDYIFTATPSFNASAYGAFSMTLTGNVTSSILTGGQFGQSILFQLCQGGSGGYTLAWPSNVTGGPVINPVQGTCTYVTALNVGAGDWDISASTVQSLGGAFDSMVSSGTPVFAAATYTSFYMSLTANVTSSTITGGTIGQFIGIHLCQDSTGGRTVIWPANLLNPPSVNPTASACTGDFAFYDGANWRTVGVTSPFSLKAIYLQAIGTQTISGCSLSDAAGGSQAGGFQSGTSGTCTVTITPQIAAPSGWSCWANDITTPADIIHQTGFLSTTATLSGTTVSGDQITWGCLAF